MKENTEICGECGRPMPYVYKRRVTKGYAEGLVKFREAVRYYGRYELEPRNEMGKGSPFELSITQHTNLTTLRQYGLLARAKHKDGSYKIGHWILTHMAVEFLNGDREIPAYILVQENEKIGTSEETRSVSEILKSQPQYDDLSDVLANREQHTGVAQERLPL